MVAAPSPGLAFRIRHAEPSDVPFIRESWLQSNSVSPSGRDAGPTYIRETKRTIAAILERTGVLAFVACDVDDPDALYGHAVLHPLGTCYFVYVKQDARRFGVARALLAPLTGLAQVEYTHRPTVRGLTLPLGWSYNATRNYR